MPSDQPPQQLVLRAVEWVMVRGGWVPAVAGAVSTALAGVLLATIGDLSKGDQWVRFGFGAALTLLSAAIVVGVDWWRRRTDSSSSSEVAQYTLTISNAIQPMAEAISAMPRQDSKTRARTAEKVVGHAASSLQLLFHNVANLRIVVYEINDDKDELRVSHYVGRLNKPRPFRLGDSGRGDAAFKMIQSSDEPLFVYDVNDGSTAGWEDHGTSYRTFVSAPIRTSEIAFGMLTIDAPEPGDISENDKGIVGVLATLLAIALGERDRR